MNFKNIIVVLLVCALFLITACSSSTKYDEFAQCLSDSGAKMFGAYWCSACSTQKKMFAKSWENVNYIECSLPNRGGQTAICQQAGIESYPTWEFANGERVSGAQPLQALAAKTGCTLPN